MTSVFTAASRTVLLSETTDRLKLEVPDAMSQQPKSYREQWRYASGSIHQQSGAHLSRATEASILTQGKLCRRLWSSHKAVLGQGCGHPRGQ